MSFCSRACLHFFTLLLALIVSGPCQSFAEVLEKVLGHEDSVPDERSVQGGRASPPKLSQAEIEERVRQRMSQIYGLPPADEEITMLVERAMRRERGNFSPSKIDPKKPILKSFHFTDGVAFSAETKAYDEQKAALKKRRQAYLRHYMTVERPKLVQKSLDNFSHPPKPPACTRGHVNQFRARSSRYSDMDLLFIAGKEPDDPDGLYGEGVRVMSYEDTPSLFSAFKVPCLPYRVYGTKDTIYYLYGEEALKKFKGHKTKGKKKQRKTEKS